MPGTGQAPHTMYVAIAVAVAVVVFRRAILRAVVAILAVVAVVLISAGAVILFTSLHW